MGCFLLLHLGCGLVCSPVKGTGQIRDLGESLHLYRVGLPFLDDEMVLDDSYRLKPKLSESFIGRKTEITEQEKNFFRRTSCSRPLLISHGGSEIMNESVKHPFLRGGLCPCATYKMNKPINQRTN